MFLWNVLYVRQSPQLQNHNTVMVENLMDCEVKRVIGSARTRGEGVLKPSLVGPKKVRFSPSHLSITFTKASRLCRVANQLPIALSLRLLAS